MHKPIFEYISANLKMLSIDEIKQRLAPVVKGMIVQSPILNAGTHLYRARKIDKEFNKAAGINCADLIYPPKRKSKLGRLNRDNESVFYCSMGKEAPFSPAATQTPTPVATSKSPTLECELAA